MSTPTIRFDRLRKLAAFLTALNPGQMNMNHVIVNRENVDFDEVKGGTPRSCGAVGCAMGWGGLMPEFRKEGLKYTKTGNLKVNGEILTFDDAASEFFNLPRPQAVWLFGPLTRWETESQAAFMNRIKAFFVMHGEPL